MKFEGM